MSDVPLEDLKSPPIFELDKVDFERGGRRILSGVSWRVLPGERWAVVGPNGCGKTTLLRLAVGQLWPNAGRIFRLGREFQDLRELWRRIGIVADVIAREIPSNEPALDTVLSGGFAQLGLQVFVGMEPREEHRERASAALERVGCSHLADRPFGVLSQGERQKVLVARACVADPILMVLDEPCAGMDPGARERFLDWLGGLLDGGGGPAVVLVTHHVEEIVPAFTHTLALAAGGAIAAGPTAEAISQAVFERLYDTRLARLEQSGGRFWPIWD